MTPSSLNFYSKSPCFTDLKKILKIYFLTLCECFCLDFRLDTTVAAYLDKIIISEPLLIIIATKCLKMSTKTSF